MSNFSDVTRREFMLQSAALASMLVGGRLPLGAQLHLARNIRRGVE